jgi:phosphoenolpyruvate phosphomutase
MRQFHPEVNVEYVHNPLYATTNYIYSLDLIPSRSLSQTIVLLHGDLIYDIELASSFLSADDGNIVLVNKDIPQPKKDFKGRIEEGRVTEIRVDIFDPNCFALMPFYKLEGKFFLHWKKIIHQFITKGITDVYAENALNTILDRENLFPYYYTNQLCMEIDTPNDLELAQSLISRKV